MEQKKKPREKRYRIWLITLLIVLTLIILLIGGISWYANSKLNHVNFDDGSREIDTSTVYEVVNDELMLGDLPELKTICRRHILWSLWKNKLISYVMK